MYTEIKTTITTRIDITTFKPDHDMDIEHEGVLPNDAVYAAVQGALKSALHTLEKRAEPEPIDLDETAPKLELVREENQD